MGSGCGCYEKNGFQFWQIEFPHPAPADQTGGCVSILLRFYFYFWLRNYTIPLFTSVSRLNTLQTAIVLERRQEVDCSLQMSSLRALELFG